MKYILLILAIFCSVSVADISYPDESHSLDKTTLDKIKYNLIPPRNLDDVAGKKNRYGEKWFLNVTAKYFPKYSTHGVCKSKTVNFYGLEKDFAGSFRKAYETKKETTLTWLPDNDDCSDEPQYKPVVLLMPIVEPDLHFILLNRSVIFNRAIAQLEKKDRDLYRHNHALSYISVEMDIEDGDFRYIAILGAPPQNTLHVSFIIVKQQLVFTEGVGLKQY
jgi:hypothetical protein